MKTVEDKYGLLQLLPGLDSALMDQFLMDAADGLCEVRGNTLQYTDGKRLVYDPETDSCRRYQVTTPVKLCYLGPRMHMAALCLLEADTNRPTVDRLVCEVDDNRLVTGVGWLLAHGFETLGSDSVSFVAARLTRHTRLYYPKGCVEINLCMHGYYEDPAKRRFPAWEVCIKEMWSAMVKTAMDRTGISLGKGDTPRKALQALLPTLVSLWRQVQELGK